MPQECRHVFFSLLLGDAAPPNGPAAAFPPADGHIPGLIPRPGMNPGGFKPFQVDPCVSSRKPITGDYPPSDHHPWGLWSSDLGDPVPQRGIQQLSRVFMEYAARGGPPRGRRSFDLRRHMGNSSKLFISLQVKSWVSQVCSIPHEGQWEESRHSLLNRFRHAAGVSPCAGASEGVQRQNLHGMTSGSGIL